MTKAMMKETEMKTEIVKMPKSNPTKWTARQRKFIGWCRLTQPELKEKLRKTYNAESYDGFLYKPGSVPVLLVAHMDTVHHDLPKDVTVIDGKVWSPQGIGGDDRCGVWMITEILKVHDCHVVFTEDEEIGCIGAKKFAKSDIAELLRGKINYVIELDRRNGNDAVFYDCGNDEFINYITTETEFKEASGSYSDICEIAPAVDASAVNFSCGYYKEHTRSEYVVWDEMETNIKKVCELLSNGSKRFEWIDRPYSSWTRYPRGWGYADGWGFDDSWGYGFNICYVEDGRMEFEYVVGDILEEAVGRFLMDHPRLCFNDITEIYDDEFCEQYL